MTSRLETHAPGPAHPRSQPSPAMATIEIRPRLAATQWPVSALFPPLPFLWQARVEIDGERRGKAAWHRRTVYEVPPGQHTIRVSSSQEFSPVVVADIEPGQRLLLDYLSPRWKHGDGKMTAFGESEVRYGWHDRLTGRIDLEDAEDDKPWEVAPPQPAAQPAFAVGSAAPLSWPDDATVTIRARPAWILLAASCLFWLYLPLVLWFVRAEVHIDGTHRGSLFWFWRKPFHVPPGRHTISVSSFAWKSPVVVVDVAPGAEVTVSYRSPISRSRTGHLTVRGAAVVRRGWETGSLVEYDGDSQSADDTTPSLIR